MACREHRRGVFLSSSRGGGAARAEWRLLELTNPSPASVVPTVKLPSALAKTTTGFGAQYRVSLFL